MPAPMSSSDDGALTTGDAEGPLPCSDESRWGADAKELLQDYQHFLLAMCL